MTLGITDDHRDLAASVRSFVTGRVTEDVIRTTIDADTESRPGFWQQMADLGLLSVHLPEDDGGAGLGITEAAVVVEELGRGLVPGPALPTIMTSAVLADAGHREHLAGLGDGSLVGAISLAAPLQAEPAADGGVVVSGTTSPVIGGALADIVVASVVGPEGFGWIVLPTSSVTATERESLDLTRRVADITVDAVTVPAADCLDTTMMRPFEIAAALLAAESSGIADWCTTTATEYAKVREQFGRPVGQFQGVKHRCAWMLARAESARAVSWDAARALDDPESGDGGSLAIAVAAATSIDAGFTNAKDCIQTLGGIGFTWEHLAGFQLRRSQANRLVMDSTAHWQQRVARLAMAGARRQFHLEYPAGADEIRARVRAELEPAVALTGTERDHYLADHGYTQPSLPEPYGKGADGMTQLVITEELAALDLAPVDMVIGNWVVPSLVHWGTDAQKEKFIAASLRGDLNWCQLFSEPGAGSDLAAIRTRAEKVDGGWKVNGQKVWTSMHRTMDYAILLARTDASVPKHKGLSYFIVDIHAPGIDIRPLRELTGETMFNEVFLDDVFIPDDMIVGRPGDGWLVAMTTLANERTSMAGLTSLGDGLETLISTGAERWSENEDLAGMTQLGELICESHIGRVFTLRETIRAMSGGQAGTASSIAKLLSAPLSQKIWETVVEWQSARGLIRGDSDRDPQWYFLNGRCLTIAGGTMDVQLNIIGERILGLPREEDPHRRVPFSERS